MHRKQTDISFILIVTCNSLTTFLSSGKGKGKCIYTALILVVHTRHYRYGSQSFTCNYTTPDFVTCLYHILHAVKVVIVDSLVLHELEVSLSKTEFSVLRSLKPACKLVWF